MYAIVNIAGKQYKVAEGDQLKVARLSTKVGGKVDFSEVLLTDDGKNVKIGSPAVNGAKVTAEVLEHGRHKKILIYKKKRRKGYQRKSGHKQDFSAIKVNSISTGTTEKPATKKAPAKKTTATKATAAKKPAAKKTPAKKTTAKTVKKDNK
jgi:large subunit ribosomal protein L21